ncbi:hypothetical protein [Microbacterium sp. H1-D42]|uniref:hypothetical protein n=1 Tax=Microbacterium sp. H1-D42 TaxID=2925844 RepID=UPI001F534AAF|nr:hypothetical protein [Microbacterium sp. H1-D42]UNK72294.1 hypothetical protein MNR00_07600 [Microbacterium sp. H1-D42]
MKNTNALTRSTPFWLLLLMSLGLTGIGGWLVTNQVTSMTSRLLDGTATNVDVYVGQAMVVFGAALLGAGLLGILLSLVLGAVKALLPAKAGAAGSAALPDVQADEVDATEFTAPETTTPVEDSEKSDADAAEESDADASDPAEREPSITR